MNDLAPYTSLLLTTVGHGAQGEEIVDQVLDDAVKTLELDDAEDSRRVLIPPRHDAAFELEPPTEEAFEIGFLHYEERRTPSWYAGDVDQRKSPRDTLNHLLLVARRGRHVAIFASEPAAKARIERDIDSGGIRGLSGLRRIPRGVLNAAYVHETETRTLWLSGIHRQTTVKADSKILAGKDLRDALDPLDDQTYFWSAARCAVALSDVPDVRPTAVGVSARRSRVWAGPCAEWPAFRAQLDALLFRLVATEGRGAHIDQPLPVLATAESDLSGLASPYDLSVITPEMIGDDPSVGESLRELAELLAYRGSFDVHPNAQDPLRFNVDISIDDLPIGQMTLKVGERDGEPHIEVFTGRAASGQENTLDEIVAFCRQPNRLTVRYESGHTIANGRVYHVRFRDVPFDNWRFADFTGFDIKKEKPGIGSAFNIPDIGIPGETSLFSWVQRHWPTTLDGEDSRQRGFLASDDGSGEVADFVHYDFEGRDVPVLTLIHVKGSHHRRVAGTTRTAAEQDAARGISASDYEVVVGQAIKNLRSLDRTNLADRLQVGEDRLGTSPGSVATATWKDGVHLESRESFIKQLRRDGEDFARRVVIVQPRVRQSKLRAARQGRDPETGRTTGAAIINRLRQLDTLLVGAQADCRDLGSSFYVIGGL